MPRPATTPVGLQLARTSAAVRRSFDAALSEAGGSLPIWLILLSVTTGEAANQRELADVVGVKAATLTHHLNAMERDGLLVRRRDPANRRIHRVELTDAGQQAFGRLAQAAVAFDKQLRRGLTSAEIATLDGLLTRLHANAQEVPDR